MTKTFSQGAAYVEGQIVPIDEAKYLCWIGVFYIPMPLMMWCMSGTVNFFVFNLIYNDFLAAWKNCACPSRTILNKWRQYWPIVFA